MADLDPIAQLAMRYLDDDLSPSEHAQLRDLLAASADARAVFVAVTMTGELVHESLNDRDSSSAPLTPVRSASAGRTHRPRITPIAWSLAAALLLSAAAVAIYLVSVAGNSPSDIPNPKSTGPAIATLIDANGTVMIGDAIGNPGSEYAAETVSIESGSAEFLLTSGASIRLHGRSRLTMHGDMAATLESGKASFNCPESAVGYTVHLPGGLRVVDLGTRFDIDLNESTVRVTQGAVQAVWPTRTIDTVVRAGAEFRFAGDTAEVLARVEFSEGGFEFDRALTVDADTGLFPPTGVWRLTGPNVGSKTSRQDRGLRPRSGDHMLGFIGRAPEPNGIECTVATEPGRTYEVRFHLARQTDRNAPSVDVDVIVGPAASPKPAAPDVLAHQAFLIDQPNDVWSAPHTVRFVARSPSTTLRFTEPRASSTVGVDPFLDDVSLYTVDAFKSAVSPDGGVPAPVSKKE